MKKVDMSEKAVTMRLKQVDQLRHLCLSLMKAKKVDDLSEAEFKEKKTKLVQKLNNESNN